MIRRRFLDDIKAIAEGKDPKAIIRDPAANRAIVLPVAERAAFIEGFTRAELMDNPLAQRGLQGYIFQTGQPAEVRTAFLVAMGLQRSGNDCRPAVLRSTGASTRALRRPSISSRIASNADLSGRHPIVGP
jgi:hypothetical protein